MNAFGVRDSSKGCAESSMSVPLKAYAIFNRPLMPTEIFTVRQRGDILTA